MASSSDKPLRSVTGSPMSRDRSSRRRKTDIIFVSREDVDRVARVLMRRRCVIRMSVGYVDERPHIPDLLDVLQTRFYVSDSFRVTAILIIVTTAHRTLIVRKLKGLEEIIPFTSVHWHMGEKGENADPVRLASITYHSKGGGLRPRKTTSRVPM